MWNDLNSLYKVVMFGFSLIILVAFIIGLAMSIH